MTEQGSPLSSTPARSLAGMLRARLSEPGAELVVATVSAVPDARHVTVTLALGEAVTVPRLSSFMPVVGDVCYVLLHRSFAIALGVVQAAGIARLLTGQVGTNTPLSNALLGVVNSGNSIEFGHTNPAGYRSLLGCDNGSGAPFLAFNGEAGTTGNTYRTRGIKAAILRSNNDGSMSVLSVANANADNQGPVFAPILASAFTVSSDRVRKVGIRRFTDADVDGTLAKLLTARAYTYRRYAGDDDQLGLMADELPDVVVVTAPPAPGPAGDAGELELDPEPPVVGVDLYRLATLTLMMVQRHAARTAAHAQRLDAQAARLDALELELAAKAAALEAADLAIDARLAALEAADLAIDARVAALEAVRPAGGDTL